MVFKQFYFAGYLSSNLKKDKDLANKFRLYYSLTLKIKKYIFRTN